MSRMSTDDGKEAIKQTSKKTKLSKGEPAEEWEEMEGKKVEVSVEPATASTQQQQQLQLQAATRLLYEQAEKGNKLARREFAALKKANEDGLNSLLLALGELVRKVDSQGRIINTMALQLTNAQQGIESLRSELSRQRSSNQYRKEGRRKQKAVADSPPSPDSPDSPVPRKRPRIQLLKATISEDEDDDKKAKGSSRSNKHASDIESFQKRGSNSDNATTTATKNSVEGEQAHGVLEEHTPVPLPSSTHTTEIEREPPPPPPNENINKDGEEDEDSETDDDDEDDEKYMKIKICFPVGQHALPRGVLKKIKTVLDGQCLLCPRKYEDNSAAREHVYTFHAHPYKCEDCGALSSSKNSRKKHKLICPGSLKSKDKKDN